MGDKILDTGTEPNETPLKSTQDQSEHLFTAIWTALYLSRFPESCFCFDYVLYSLSHMLCHVTSSANGQLYTIKINKDLLMRLLKRDVLYAV